MTLLERKFRRPNGALDPSGFYGKFFQQLSSTKYHNSRAAGVGQ